MQVSGEGRAQGFLGLGRGVVAGSLHKAVCCQLTTLSCAESRRRGGPKIVPVEGHSDGCCSCK